MAILRYIQKLQQLDALIRKRSTGNQKEFCRKTSMSRSLLNNYLSEMKALGFPIEYDKEKNTYYYSEEGSLAPRLFQHKLDDNEMKKFSGGFTPFLEIFG